MNNFANNENIYGHKNRLSWIKTHLSKTDKILDFGCGTGYMITCPLRIGGYNIIGIDVDEESIAYGEKHFAEKEKFLFCQNADDLAERYDVIIASEVLEHLEDNELKRVIEIFHRLLKENGTLLITVPNGYGWFEMENFFWGKLKFGKAFEVLKITAITAWLKRNLLKYTAGCHPSTLSGSSHVQRFTVKKIHKLMEPKYRIIEISGSTLIAGGFSDTLFSGFYNITSLNTKIGRKFFPYLCGYYICARKLECLPKPNMPERL